MPLNSSTAKPRCDAAHPTDPSPCDGPDDAVIVRDRFMSRARDAMTEGVTGCVHHGARMLASLEGGRIYPGPADRPGSEVHGAAIKAFRLARHLPPFAWLTEDER